MAKKKRTTKSSTTRSSKKKTRRAAGAGASALNKQLVIVESPAKAKTINRYLGPDFIVKASVGHIRDLPTKAPKVARKGKGKTKVKKQPVPGVDLENGFKPTYEVLPRKEKVVAELKKAAKEASDVWFATDLDREGEAIAWHLAQELGVDPANAKRVVFNAITKSEIQEAFANPHTIDMAKVNAQQARRVLDRIVGYQVSPLLWKKVARGLSAGRVQSVAVRLIVERDREIEEFVPDEHWKMHARFALHPEQAPALQPEWEKFISERDSKGAGPTIKAQNAWLSEHSSIKAELVKFADSKFDVSQTGADDKAPADLTPSVLEIAELAGLTDIDTSVTENDEGKGPAKYLRTVTGRVDPATPYKIVSITTKRTSSRPPAPFITSTLQQAASSRLGFGARRTMGVAQKLYEGVTIPGEGAVGLITYMRTDSTHLSKDAMSMARDYISATYGSAHLPDKPNFFGSSNKQAQEAHEAIRPTSADRTPDSLRSALPPDQLKLYKLIWERFVASQMTPAKWDATAVLIEGGSDASRPLTFRATGRKLVFDGFYRVAGVPTASDELTLPEMAEEQAVAPFSIAPDQSFTSPPAAYTEASLVKTLETEGIGRPSTYASIIQVIQDRKYVEPIERKLRSTDLGQVVTKKLIEAFPEIMKIGYTRELEKNLDRIEEDNADWVKLLADFYEPFKEQLERAHEDLMHAKAETQPAPEEYRCEKCDASLVYRFGKNGRFLSCSRYPDCAYASPCDRQGKPQPIQTVDVACHLCSGPMIKRTGRFGPFYGCSKYPECSGILKADKKTGKPLAPQPPPLPTDLPCTKCEDSHLVLRDGVRGPWLSCSRYPKCRGRGKWTELTEDVKKKWENALAEHLKEHPIPVIRTLSGVPLTDAKGKPIVTEDADDGLEPTDTAAKSAA